MRGNLSTEAGRGTSGCYMERSNPVGVYASYDSCSSGEAWLCLASEPVLTDNSLGLPGFSARMLDLFQMPLRPPVERGQRRHERLP